MRSFGFCVFILAGFGVSGRLFAGEANGSVIDNSILKLVPVSEISDGYLGSKRLYFNLRCNERFLQVLTERTTPTTLDVGILLEELEFSCNRPDREVFGRVSPDGNSLRPVTAFKEVWYCSAMCYSGGAPNLPPYKFVSAFGTSEKQATYNLPCSSGFIIDLRCDQEDVQ